MLAGNVVALLTPAITIPLFTLIFGMDNYDFEKFKQITRADDSEFWKVDAVEELGGSDEVASIREKKQANAPNKSTGESSAPENGMVAEYEVDDSLSDEAPIHIEELDPAEKALLDKYAKISRIITIVMAVCLLVLWPMTMYGTGYVFSKKFFTGWVAVGFVWIFFSTIMVIIYPCGSRDRVSSRPSEACTGTVPDKLGSCEDGRARRRISRWQLMESLEQFPTLRDSRGGG